MGCCCHKSVVQGDSDKVSQQRNPLDDSIDIDMIPANSIGPSEASACVANVIVNNNNPTLPPSTVADHQSVDDDGKNDNANDDAPREASPIFDLELKQSPPVKTTTAYALHDDVDPFTSSNPSEILLEGEEISGSSSHFSVSCMEDEENSESKSKQQKEIASTFSASFTYKSMTPTTSIYRKSSQRNPRKSVSFSRQEPLTVISDMDGSVYKGATRNRGDRHGKGTLFTATGDVYDGDWKDDCFIRGNVKYASGATYIGDFLNGRKHGQGVLTDPDGAVYSGGFLCGERYGQGTQIFPNGDSYIGEWVGNQPHGNGCLRTVTGSGLLTSSSSDGNTADRSNSQGPGPPSVVVMQGLWVRGKLCLENCTTNASDNKEPPGK
eukprot:PhF_6_TR8353/c1_g1_i3/m.13101/K19755/RSPH1; radial spoke head protein 1